MNSSRAESGSAAVQLADDLDALVIGAGVSGINALYALQQLGIRVQLAERGSGVGGTWFWNRYPGARFDSDSVSYQFFFDDCLADEWQWSEHFAGQPEIERYYNFVVDRFDLRKNICLNAEVVAACFDEATSTWRVEFADGKTVTTKYLVAATGMLSQPYVPPMAGLEDFEGTLVHTGEWPEEGVDLVGKRVAVIGTGSSGIQVIPLAAGVATSLTVFQRGGHWSTPLNNRPISDEERAEFRKNFRELQRRRQAHPGGFIHEVDMRRTSEVAEDERLRKYEEIYASMGLRSLTSNFMDTLTDPEANRLYTEFVADKIRQRIHDKELAERLIPKDHGYGTHRPPKDTGYFEAYNRDNVQLVTLGDTPIEAITPRGIRTTAEEFEFDVIVLATGFDPWIGALKRIDIRGTTNENLVDRYISAGPKTNLGVTVPDYPNLFFIGGLHSIAGNAPASIENHVHFVAGLVDYAEKHGYSKVETSPEAAEEWTEFVYEADDRGQIFAKGTWYTGANIEGGPRFKTLIYEGGIGAWRDRAKAIADSGYKGLQFS